MAEGPATKACLSARQRRLRWRYQAHRNSTHDIPTTFQKLAANGANLVTVRSVQELYIYTSNKGKKAESNRKITSS
ncbi:hypothetical protein PG996_006827 [Apiospora saccharicola]|uniref:Uncharacterized protein n=1 Tax=Apiospora saccharicola TaxID=335842 RepID=A0ABR1VBU3_9PEZI